MRTTGSVSERHDAPRPARPARQVAVFSERPRHATKRTIVVSASRKVGVVAGERVPIEDPYPMRDAAALEGRRANLRRWKKRPRE